MADGATYPARIVHSDGTVVSDGSIIYDTSSNQPAPPTNPTTSGTLSSLSAWVSGTAKQNPTTAAGPARAVTVALAPTGDASNNAATVLVALSPDNTTYTTLTTWSVAAAINNLGAFTDLVEVQVPAGWWIKLTIGAHATVAQSVWY